MSCKEKQTFEWQFIINTKYIELTLFSRQQPSQLAMIYVKHAKIYYWWTTTNLSLLKCRSTDHNNHYQVISNNYNSFLSRVNRLFNINKIYAINYQKTKIEY